MNESSDLTNTTRLLIFIWDVDKNFERSEELAGMWSVVRRTTGKEARVKQTSVWMTSLVKVSSPLIFSVSVAFNIYTNRFASLYGYMADFKLLT
jgi:hypothetical protein